VCRVPCGRKRGFVVIAAKPRLCHLQPVANGPRRVVVLIYPGVQALDAVGPLEVLHAANRLLQASGKPAAYAIELVAPTAGPQQTRSGYALVAQRPYASVRGAIDTLIVAGGEGARVARADRALLSFVRRTARRVRRLCSVCTGALILAEAGLLDGRRATTHWASCAQLQARHPKVRVERDPIFVQDGAVYTSAGVTAGIDLTLALVEADVGAELSRTVARWLVVFLQRPGGQAQFSAQLAAQPAQATDFKQLQGYIAEHPERDLSVPALAARVGMSPRNFARRFHSELGVTPARYVRSVRVETARARLEQGSESVERIAERCGFGTEESMRRSFLALVRVAPRNYRQRFARARSAAQPNTKRRTA